MSQRVFRWFITVLPVFILSLAAVGYLLLQQRGSDSPAFANFLAAEKGYGVTIDMTRYDDDALDRTLAAMHANGFTWLRQPVHWAAVEAQPGQFDWRQLDRVITAAPPSFKLIMVLQTPPAWTRPAGNNPDTPPEQFSDFGRFARAFAQRYGDQIKYYQIWHQPNLSANWGNTYVDAAAYTNLLREAALNIRDVDSTATILTAALAATTQDNPLNLSEIVYLDQLYQAKADNWFDVVAVQPYGLWTKPLDPPSPDQPNFRRAELVRQVMLANGDADTPIWATAFGWVALPADWAGQASPWSYDLPEVQTDRTAQAINYARANWPWMGPMLAVRWDASGLADDDPARGFAVQETLPLLQLFLDAAEREKITTPGSYPANHPAGQVSPGWRFATTRADISPTHPRTLTIPFDGTRLDLNINRGPFRGYLWVTVDGQPANALPQNGQGQSYVVLYDPLREAAAVTLAQHLPKGQYVAVIEADGGWEQWPIEGWSVYNEADTRVTQSWLIVMAVLAIASGVGLLLLLVSAFDQIAKLLWGWGETLIAGYAVLTEPGQIIVTGALAAALYFTSGTVSLALLALLAGAVILRPDLGLALVTVALFFFQTPVQLPVGSFSPVELALAFTVAGLVFRTLLHVGRTRYAPREVLFSNRKSKIRNPKSTDFAALALILLAFLATLSAEHFAVSFRQWRVVVVESALFYFLVRLGMDFSPAKNLEAQPSSRWVWRLVDAFVAGAALQAGLALYLYFFTDRSIDAEGVHRALGLGYGSPNNLALVLGRAWPVLLSVAVLPGQSMARRGGYGAGLLMTSLALYLTFSKGALLVGLPACLVAMTLFYGLRLRQPNWRRIVGAVAGVMALFSLALIPFSQTERFRATFNFEEGSTAFFRVKLWQASWQMLKDYWPLGVGPDNFLYHYRTRYILPEAWQEPDLNHPHNLFLDFGTRLGIGGIAVLLWLQIAYWRNAWMLYRGRFSSLLLGLMGSMVVFLAHGLVDNSYFLVDLAFAFFLNVGIVQRWVEDRIHKRQ